VTKQTEQADASHPPARIVECGSWLVLASALAFSHFGNGKMQSLTALNALMRNICPRPASGLAKQKQP